MGNTLKNNIGYLIKIVAIGFLVSLFTMYSKIQELYSAIYDSYTGVGIFVAGTLLVIYIFEHYTQNAMLSFLIKHQKLQVPFSAMLGVLPGCGGAIIVVTQYSKGYVTFGSMVATLIATMGDAAILLIQKKPQMALLLFIIVSFVAIVVGYAVDLIYGEKKFAKPKPMKVAIPPTKGYLSNVAETIWFFLFALNVIFYCLPLFLQEQAFVYKATQCVNVAGIIYTIGLWLFKNPNHSCESQGCQTCSGVLNKVAIESSFIIVWIFIGLTLYKATEIIWNFDIANLMNNNIYWVPLLSAIVGLIPGCGPQILVTTLYVNNTIPFAAQIANAISNDGDALVPAIAMRPRQAFIATVYGFFPALIVGYIVLFVELGIK
jgi:hypothetical protein